MTFVELTKTFDAQIYLYRPFSRAFTFGPWGDGVEARSLEVLRSISTEEELVEALWRVVRRDSALCIGTPHAGTVYRIRAVEVPTYPGF